MIEFGFSTPVPPPLGQGKLKGTLALRNSRSSEGGEAATPRWRGRGGRKGQKRRGGRERERERGGRRNARERERKGNERGRKKKNRGRENFGLHSAEISIYILSQISIYIRSFGSNFGLQLHSAEISVYILSQIFTYTSVDFATISVHNRSDFSLHSLPV